MCEGALDDRLDAEGNDYPVEAAGYPTRAVGLARVRRGDPPDRGGTRRPVGGPADAGPVPARTESDWRTVLAVEAACALLDSR